jgi:superfamily II DNA or RNA helicase
LRKEVDLLSRVSGENFLAVEKAIAGLSPMSLQGATWEALLREWLVAEPLTGIKQVWRWQDWPGRRSAGLSSQDLGVDLVGVDADGLLIGIQAKFRNNPESSITTPEVQKFIGAYQGLFGRRVIGSNAENVSMNVPRGTTNVVSYFLRHHFTNSKVDWSSLCVGKQLTPAPRFNLEPYQEEAVNAVCQTLRTSPRAQLIMACGTGKSFTMLKIAEALEAERVLVLAPTLLLVGQLRAEWTQQASSAFVDLAVCSDQSLSRSNRDEADIDTTEFGGHVTTDVGVISRFLRHSGRRVVFGTYASSPQIAAAQQEQRIEPFDLIVCDEAHRLAGSEQKDAKSEDSYKIVLESNGIRSKKRLFATATPRIYGGSTRYNLDGTELAIDSMDSEDRFGKVAFNFSFRSAIEAKPRPRLVPYQVLVTVVTDDEVQQAIDQRLWADSNIDFETVASAFAVERAFQEYPIRRMISYHSSLDRARQFAGMLSNRTVHAETLQTAMVSGKDPVSERQAILGSLRLGLHPTLVTNARCLTEGVDVPALDAVAFIDPRSSRVDIVQAVGRAMRISPGKTTGYVIVPLYLRPEQIHGHDAIDGASFKPVLDVLRALKAHDPLIAEFFTSISMGAGTRKNIRSDIEKVVLLDSAPKAQAGLMDKIARSISLEAISVTAGGFWRTFAELKEFVEANGGQPTVWKLPHGPGNHIRTWASAQRNRYRSGLLSHDRIVALESLKGWTWTSFDNRTNSHMEAIKDYVENGGELPIPADAVVAGRQIGKFYSVLLRRLILGIMGQTQLKELSSISEELVPKRIHSAHEYVLALQEYLKSRPIALIEQSTVFNGVELGQWVFAVWSTQEGPDSRKVLTPDVIEALDGLEGWAWNKREARIEMGIAYLRKFQLREGHTNVADGHVEDEFPLGVWIKNQRYQHQIGYMSGKLTRQFEAIPSWEWIPDLSEVLQHGVAIGMYFRRLVTGDRSDVAKDTECAKRVLKLRRLQHQLQPSDRKRVERIWGWSWSSDDQKSFISMLKELTDVATSAKGLRPDLLETIRISAKGRTLNEDFGMLRRQLGHISYVDESNQWVFLKLARWCERVRSSTGVPLGQLDAVEELLPLQKLGIRRSMHV